MAWTIAYYSKRYQSALADNGGNLKSHALYNFNNDRFDGSDMDEKQRKKIADQINQQIEETRQDISSFSEQVRPIAPDNAIGRLSRMEAIGAKSINEASLARARTRLEQLKAVLADLDDPDFGICIECDEQIPLGRIMLMPESRLCVRCAGRLEKG